MDQIPLAVSFPESPTPKFWMRFSTDEDEYEYDLDADEVVLRGVVSWSFCRLDGQDVVRHWVAPMVVRFPWP